MRIAFAALMFAHASIHLLGFVKGFELAPVAQLTLPISRTAGALWLGAGCAVGLATALFLARVEAWWLVGAVAVILSQAAIVGAWADAKFGTLANLILLLVALLGAGAHHFSRTTGAEIDALLAGAGPSDAPAGSALPPAVSRWLARSGASDASAPTTVRLTQRGEMQLSPGGGFVPFTAQQYFRTREPAFAWRVHLSMFGLPIVGRDTWRDGRGRMRIEAAGLVPIVDEAGPRIDQGALLRYLGELVWFPAAARSPHVSWQEGEDPAHQARASLRYGDTEAAADFTFDDEGRFVSLRAMRYRGGGADAALTPWTVRATAWARVPPAGVEIPSRGEVVWHLPEGDYVFFRYEVTGIEYDVRAPFDAPP